MDEWDWLAGWLAGWTDARAFWVPNDPCTIWLPELMDGQRQKDRLSLGASNANFTQINLDGRTDRPKTDRPLKSLSNLERTLRRPGVTSGEFVDQFARLRPIP